MIARTWALLCRLVLIAGVALLIVGSCHLVLNHTVQVLIAAVVWRGVSAAKSGGSAWTHGSACFAGWATLAKGAMLCESGLIFGDTGLLGRPNKLAATLGLISPFQGSEVACRAFLAAFFGGGWQTARLIRIKTFQHIATFAKTGGGKGVALIIPNLLSYRQSVVVADIKGELWSLTAQHRRQRFGHRVIRLDPDGLAGPISDSATLNPLDHIDDNSDAFLDDCRELAGQMVTKTGKETEAHWIESATLVLTAFIAFVCGCEADPTKRNLNTVRAFVASRVAFANAIQIMQLQTDACQGVIARLGGMLTWYVDRELGSVLSTCQRFTQFLDSPQVQRNVSSSSFDPRLLRSGRASVYLCLAHNKIESLAPLQRMWISTIMRVLATDGTGERNSVLFVLDEAAHLGRVEAVERAISLYRGMGIKIWFAFQSLNQVKEVFGDKAETILDNIGTKQFFSVSSWESAEAISKQIGETTIQIVSTNQTRSNSHPTGGSSQTGNQPGSSSTSSATTTSDMARRLLRPEEILGLGDDTSLLFHNNRPVVLARLIKYYNHPAFRRGGTGQPRPLSLGAGLVAASVLLLGSGLLSLASGLPLPDRMNRLLAPPLRRVTPSPGSAKPHRQPAYQRWQTPRRITRP